MRDAGVVVTVNSDDPPMFGTTLNREYEIAAGLLDLDEAGVADLAVAAVDASFAPDDVKDRLRAEIARTLAAPAAEAGQRSAEVTTTAPAPNDASAQRLDACRRRGRRSTRPVRRRRLAIAVSSPGSSTRRRLARRPTAAALRSGGARGRGDGSAAIVSYSASGTAPVTVRVDPSKVPVTA